MQVYWIVVLHVIDKIFMLDPVMQNIHFDFLHPAVLCLHSSKCIEHCIGIFYRKFVSEKEPGNKSGLLICLSINPQGE